VILRKSWQQCNE
jgi:ribosome production factor 2